MAQMLAKIRRPATRPTPTGVIVLGDAAVVTLGGGGSSVEQKRYPYG